jgi:hypothetical protein
MTLKSKLSTAISLGLLFSLAAVFVSSWVHILAHNLDLFLIICYLVLFFCVFHLMSLYLTSLIAKKRVLWLLIIGLSLRAAWILCVKNELVSDFAIYHELALALISGKGYAVTGPVGVEDMLRYLSPSHPLPYTTAYRAPGTSLWAAGLYLIFGAHPGVFKIFNVFLSLATGFLLAGVACPKNDDDAGTKITLLWMLYPASIFAVNLVGSETLFTFFIVLTAWLFTRADFFRRPYLLLAISGIVGAWAILVRPMIALFLAATLISFSAKQSLFSATKRGALFLLFFAIGLTPWALRNYRVFGQFVPVCTSEGEFLGRHTRFNLPSDKRVDSVDPEYIAWRSLTNEVERSKEGYSLAVKNMEGMFRAGVRHTARTLLRNINASFSTDTDVLIWSQKRSYELAYKEGPPNVLNESILTQFSAIVTAYYLLMVSMAFFGSWQFDQKIISYAGGTFLILFYLVSFYSLMMVMGQNRYHFSMMPAVVVLAAFNQKKIKHLNVA